MSRISQHSRNEVYIFDADTLKVVQSNLCARENPGCSLDEGSRSRSSPDGTLVLADNYGDWRLFSTGSGKQPLKFASRPNRSFS